LKTILCIGVLGGLLTFSGHAWAQNTNTNDLGWPEVPEIANPPAQAPNNARDTRNGQARVISGWPGTDRPGSAPASVPEAVKPAVRAETPNANTRSPTRTRRNEVRSRPSNPAPSARARIIERNDPTGEESIEADISNEPEKRNVKARLVEDDPKPSIAKGGREQPKDPTASASEIEKNGNDTDGPEADGVRGSAAIDDRSSPPVAANTAIGPVLGETSPSIVAPKTNREALEKMIGQMIVTDFDGLEPDDEGVKQVIQGLGQGWIGGVIIKGRNVRSPSQLKGLVEAFRSAGSEPSPLLMIEYAGGDGQALSVDKGFSNYPSAGELGQSNDALNAFNVYQHMAEELESYGFTVNLGPSLELQSGEQGTALEKETSFGASAKHVAAFVKAFQLAHEQAAIMTAPKIFSGSGGKPGKKQEPDGHQRGGSFQDLSAGATLQLYREIVTSSDTPMVVIGHAADADLTGQGNIPASLSKRAIQDLLRNELGFQGVAIAADLEAPALAERFSLAERVELAIAAGNDIVQIGDDQGLDRIVSTVKYAVVQEKLTRERIELSYNRILALKRRIGGAANSIISAERARTYNQPSTR
jgi:beta-N-acetylhexosaminidase